MSFESARQKIARADEHLGDLDDEIGAYLRAEPFKLVLNIQPSDQRIVLIELGAAPVEGRGAVADKSCG